MFERDDSFFPLYSLLFFVLLNVSDGVYRVGACWVGVDS